MSPTDPDGNRHALLVEGARSYLEAFTAITIFRKEVRAVCEKVMKSGLERFLEVLGVPTDQAESLLPADTPEAEFNGSSAYVGIKQRISRRLKQGFRCDSSCGVSWELVGQKKWFGCWVAVYFNQRDLADRLHSGFQRSKVSLPSGIELGSQKNNVWLSREIKPEDIGSLSDRLGEVLETWVRLWEEFGGLDALAST
jgi:hypothetical protein